VIAVKDALEKSDALAGSRGGNSDTVRGGHVRFPGSYGTREAAHMFAARCEVNVRCGTRAGPPLNLRGGKDAYRADFRQRVVTIGADRAAVEPNCGLDAYDTRSGRNNIVFYLPENHLEQYSEVTFVSEPKQYDALCAYLEEAAYFEALKTVPEDAEVVSHHAIFKIDGCVMSAAVYIHTHEDIGRTMILED
jgi:hypothetical protein